MVIICTNRPEYRNDIAEEIMLFLGFVETVLLAPDEPEPCDAQLHVNVTLTPVENKSRRLRASAGKAALMRDFFIQDGTPLGVKKMEKRQIKLVVYDLMRALYPEVETPWGSLTGIRPTKLFRELSDSFGTESAREQFLHVFSVSPEKTGLAEQICAVQQPLIESVRANDVDIYVGIPFCKTRCLYCSFISEVLRSDTLLTDYLAALKRDVLAGAALVRDGGYRVRAIYVGGGTPTVLSAGQLEDLLTTTFCAYGGLGAECTVEAGRPDTIDRDKLFVLRRLGVGRISINPQSMNDDTLRRVGRAHTARETCRAFHLAREIGFATINMDVIAGLPGETPDDMRRTYDAVASLAPENLTVHTLAVKRSSLLKTKLAEYPLAAPADAALMVADGARTAAQMGMSPYYMYRQKYMRGNLENVGYAQPGHVCVYNIDMMEETAGILSHGAGSMTKRVFGAGQRIERLPNPKDISTYLNKLPFLLGQKRRFFLD